MTAPLIMRQQFLSAAQLRTQRPVPGRATAAALCTCIFAAALLLVVPTSTLVGSHPERIVWAAAAVSILLAVYVVRRSRRMGVNPWASAIALTVVYYAFRYGWGALVVYYWERLPWQAVPLLRLRFYYQGSRLAVEDICNLIILGAVGLVIGFLIPVSRIVRLMPSITWPVDERRLKRNALIAIPIMLFLFLVLSRRAPESIRAAIDMAGQFVYLLIVLCAFWLFSSTSIYERSKWLIVLISTGATSLILGLMTGSVGQLLAPAEFTVFGFMIAKRRFPWKLMAVTLVLGFVVLFPFLTIYKEVAADHHDSPIPARIAYAVEKMHTVDYRRGIEISADRFIARMAESSYPPIFARYFPNAYAYQNGHTLWLETATLLPRLIWRHKVSLSQEMDRYSAGVGLIPEGGTTSAVIDAVSEYYINFGAPGVLGLSILHGLCLSVLTAWLMQNLGSPLGAILSAAIFFSNPELFGIGFAFNSLVKAFPVWLLLLYLLSRRHVVHMLALSKR